MGSQFGWIIPFVFLCCIFRRPPLSFVFPPVFNPVPLELPFSKAVINTAGSNGAELIIDGIEDANAFRRMVMELKNRSRAQARSAPQQQGMPGMPATPEVLVASSEVVALLQGIAL